jgi:hypothetical protein
LGKLFNDHLNNNVTPETEPLELIHVDMWGKAQTMSLGGAQYMMLVADGGSDMKFPFFLADKRSENIVSTLEAFR